MSQSHYTINEVSEPRFAGEEARAVLVEDDERGLILFLVDSDHVPVFSFRYHGEPDEDGMTYEEMAAADWIALHVASADPDKDGWDNELCGAEERFTSLVRSDRGFVLADTSLIDEGNPLGLDASDPDRVAAAFIRAAIDGVPEYDDLARRLENRV